jgi:hypothetical protein
MSSQGGRLLRAAVLAGCAVACKSGSSPSQPAAGPAPAAQEVLNHTFTLTANEALRIPLAGGATYRAELDGTSIQLELRPMEPGTQRPLVQELLPGIGASGVTVYSIKPRADGVYEFRTVGGDAGRPVTLHLIREKAS